jgi:hypothetical protein
MKVLPVSLAAEHSQPGDYLSVCIDEVEQIGYSCDSFYYYPESYKYQIKIDLLDLCGEKIACY